MEYDGLALKYPVNRPLTDEERRQRLEVNVEASTEPSAAFCSIAESAGCAEFVDKYYAWKGMIAALVVAPLVFFLVLLVDAPAAIAKGMSKTAASDMWIGWTASFFVLAVNLFLVLLFAWALSRESFTFTHFPVRFNRRTRTVYVFRPKRRADILRVRWDDVYWHIRRNKNRHFGSYNWFLAGHVMAKDRKTVLETFALGPVSSRPEDVYPFWEYVRRFMEKGPNALPAPEVYLPVTGRREGFWWGAQTIVLNTPGSIVASVFLLPFTAPGAIARWLCMLTNRMPVWPEVVEKECGPTDEPSRGPKAEAKPEYGKLVVLLIVGLLMDSAIGAWVYSISPLAK